MQEIRTMNIMFANAECVFKSLAKSVIFEREMRPSIVCLCVLQNIRSSNYRITDWKSVDEMKRAEFRLKYLVLPWALHFPRKYTPYFVYAVQCTMYMHIDNQDEIFV